MDSLLNALSLYAGTFVLEDGTTIAGGLMVHEGRIPFLLAFVALSLGITCGDTVLFALGWLAGSWKPLRRFVGERRLEAARVWTRSHLARTLAVARLLPAARTPIYIAAGVVHAPVRKYVFTTLLASMVYVFLLLNLTIWLGRAIGLKLEVCKWVLIAIPVGLFTCRFAWRRCVAWRVKHEEATDDHPAQLLV